MKYGIVIPDGAADEPLDELDGRTPLQAAETPNMDWIAEVGRIGTVSNIPDDLPAGSDVAILSVLGYDPAEYYTGRAPLEAAARDIRTDEDEWIFRCNLVTIIDGIMQDYSAGHISNEESHAMITMLQGVFGGEGINLHPGVGYRHILTYRGAMDLTTTPPHDILGEPVEKFLPRGIGATAIREIMAKAHDLLATHEINLVRKDLGENLATDIWLWGEGKMPTVPSFRERFGLDGAAITAVDLVRGISKLIGWDVIEVEGATGYVETNYAGKGVAGVGALDDHDVVLVHVEAPDESGHNAAVADKVRSLEEIDRHIVGPMIRRLQREDDEWRILVLPDHPTPCRVRTHTREPVPFAIAGKDMMHVVSGPFCEDTAERSDLHIERGSALMEYFLTVR